MATQDELLKIVRDSLRPVQTVNGIINENEGTVECFTQAFQQNTITKMSFYNSSAYQLTVKRYDSKVNALSTVFTYSVGAGNRLEDTEIYLLYEGDYLFLLSDIAGTTYEITHSAIDLVSRDQQIILAQPRIGSNIITDYSEKSRDV